MHIKCLKYFVMYIFVCVCIFIPYSTFCFLVTKSWIQGMYVCMCVCMYACSMYVRKAGGGAVFPAEGQQFFVEGTNRPQ
jgi:hypothetical protein